MSKVFEWLRHQRCFKYDEVYVQPKRSPGPSISSSGSGSGSFFLAGSGFFYYFFFSSLAAGLAAPPAGAAVPTLLMPFLISCIYKSKYFIEFLSFEGWDNSFNFFFINRLSSCLKNAANCSCILNYIIRYQALCLKGLRVRTLRCTALYMWLIFISNIPNLFI